MRQRNSTQKARLTTHPADAAIEECPGGPLLVRGAVRVTVEGESRKVERPVVAICRCHLSALFPYCDSTHKKLAAADATNPSR